MNSESAHSSYVRAYKYSVSRANDLIFSLTDKQISDFYMLKPKTEYILEIRSLIHQVIG